MESDINLRHLFKLSELPHGWVHSSVDALFVSESVGNKKLAQKQYQKSGKYPVVDQGAEFIGGFSDDNDLVVKVGESQAFIIFGDHSRVFKLVDFDFIPGADGIKVLKPLCVLPKWAYYFLQAIPLPNKGYARHYQYLKEAYLPLPPLTIQKKIVEKIDELFSHIDAGVEGLKQTKAKLQQYRQSVLKDAVTGKLTEKWREQNADKLEPADKLLERILAERRKNWELEQLRTFAKKGSLPKGDKWKEKYKEPSSSFDSNPPFELPDSWQWCYFESIGFVSGGLTKSIKKNTNQRKIPYLRVANVYANELRLDEIHEIGVSETELDRVLLQDKDLLIVEGNGSPEQIGRIAIWNDSIRPCVHQNHLIKVRLIEKTLSEFIVFWLMSLHGREQIKAVASSTSGLYTLSISKISSLPIPLPPLQEAKEISSLVAEKLAAAFKTEEELDHKVKLSARLKAAILSKAFSGRLVGNEETDETAEDLLERILNEKLKSLTNDRITQRKIKKKANIMNKRPIFEVIKEARKALKVEEIFELAGFQNDVSPEGVEAFYQELKAVSAHTEIKVTPFFLDKKKQGDKFEYKEVGE